MKDKIIVGYDLGDGFSQISYCTYDDAAPETLAVIAGTESYNIPTVLCKRQGVNQWFYGKEAIKHAETEGGSLLTNLVELARQGEKVVLEETEFDPVALLTLFVKRSLALISMVSGVEKIGALMITCENLDPVMVDILNTVVAGLSLKTKTICYQSHVESVYYYTLHQPTELWQRQVLICDYNGAGIKVYRMECNRRTTPIVAFVEESVFPFRDYRELTEAEVMRESIAGRMDTEFLEILQKLNEGQIISSAYLLGDGFKEEWMKESLQYLCRGKRVFQGNNLYSKGACLGMREKISPSAIGKEYVFLGKEKLKANVGMRVMRRGEASYCALLDAGTSWYEANHVLEFLLETDNTFTLVITPLNGREIKYAQVTLEGLPLRPNAASRLRMELDMPTETCIRLTVEDLGFGEIFPASNQKWTESFEVA